MVATRRQRSRSQSSLSEDAESDTNNNDVQPSNFSSSSHKTTKKTTKKTKKQKQAPKDKQKQAPKDATAKKERLTVVDEGESASPVDGEEDSAKDNMQEEEVEEEEELAGIFVLDRKGDDGGEVLAVTTHQTQEPAVDGDPGYGMSAARKPRKNKREKKERNDLTKLIPGYTAPMKLDTSSLDKYRPAGGIKELQRQAERTDASTRDFVIDRTKKHTDAMQKSSGTSGLLNGGYEAAHSSFKKGKKRAIDTTAGKGWFGMVPTPMTEDLKTDLAVIRNRNYLDPKKFYKSADKHGSVLQVGTVIEGASEYYSSRLTKKERRNNITEEIMADPASADYARNKFRKMAQEKTLQAQKRKRVHKPKRGKKLY